MSIHRHHSTPVSQGGMGPIQLVEDRDHAYIHFHRFQNGEDRWFHGGLLRFLDPWDQDTVRQLWKERGRGENNPMFGVPSPVTGFNWWTDGTLDKLTDTQPGPSWRLGRTQMDNSQRTYRSGHTIFTNGVTEVHGYECPDGFWEGRLPQSEETKKKRSLSQTGKTWWNNGEEEVLGRTQPEGFVRGRLSNPSNRWVKVQVLDTLTGKTTVFDTIKHCHTHFGVTKKVLRRRLETGKPLLNRYHVRRLEG